MNKENFKQQLKQLQHKVLSTKQELRTEEATKNALIMPMLSLLGYDVFNPDKVIPEYTADVGVKNGEKVDYVLKHKGKISVLVECKTYKRPLTDDFVTQLFRYFSVTDAKIGLLTDGNKYRFYSDFVKPNVMDLKPFATIEMKTLTDKDIDVLWNITDANYSYENLKIIRTNRLYKQNILKYLSKANYNIPDTTTVLTQQNVTQTVIQNIITESFPGWKLDTYTLNYMTPIVIDALKTYQYIKSTQGARPVNDNPATRSEVTVENIRTVLPITSLKIVQTDKTKKYTGPKAITPELMQTLNILKSYLDNIFDLDQVIGREAIDYVAINTDDISTHWVARVYKQSNVSNMLIEYNDSVNTRSRFNTLTEAAVEDFRNVAMFRAVNGYISDANFVVKEHRKAGKPNKRQRKRNKSRSKSNTNSTSKDEVHRTHQGYGINNQMQLVLSRTPKVPKLTEDSEFVKVERLNTRADATTKSTLSSLLKSITNSYKRNFNTDNASYIRPNGSKITIHKPSKEAINFLKNIGFAFIATILESRVSSKKQSV